MSATPGLLEMDAPEHALGRGEATKRGAALEQVRAVWSRRKWLGILVCTVPFAAAAGVIFSMPDLYRSSATVLVERQQVPEAFVRPTVTSELETRLHTISQEILSRSRLEELISRFGLYADLRKHESGEEILERMRRDIRLDIRSTDARRRQSVTVAFTLSYLGRDPRTVALVTNTLASFYIEENLKARGRQASGTTEFLQVQVDETKKRLDEQERRVSEFRKRYLGELPQQMQGNLTTLETLNTQLRLNSDNQVRAAERRAALATQLTAAASFGQALDPSAGMPDLPAVRLARLRQDLSAARARYTESYPDIVHLKAEISAVERELAGGAEPEPAEAKAERNGEPAVIPPSPYVSRLRETLHATDAEVKILKAEEQRLRSAIASYQARVENTPKREQEFQEVSRDYESTREQHQSLVKRYEEAQLAESMEQRQKGEQFRVLDPAVPSAVTAAPNRTRLLLMVLMLSLGLAAGAVTLAEMADTSFRSARELSVFTDMPILARIPRIITEPDRRRRLVRFRLAAAATILGLVVIVGASYYVGHGNEQLVRMLERT